MSKIMRCDAKGCGKETALRDSRWWTLSSAEVIGGVGTGRQVEVYFCSKECVAVWCGPSKTYWIAELREDKLIVTPASSPETEKP